MADGRENMRMSLAPKCPMAVDLGSEFLQNTPCRVRVVSILGASECAQVQLPRGAAIKKAWAGSTNCLAGPSLEAVGIEMDISGSIGGLPVSHRLEMRDGREKSVCPR